MYILHKYFISILLFVIIPMTTLTPAFLAGSVEYTDSISTEELDPPTSVLKMTLNNLMVRNAE